MGAPIPEISVQRFQERLLGASPVPLDEGALGRLRAHYEELRLWNRRLSLVGPCTEDELLGRHYAESLAALPLLPTGPATLLDVGSGAGFPGMVLAAVRTDISVTLVEPRVRKWAFLLAAARRAALPCRCLNARVGTPIPESIPAVTDLVTSRALSLTPLLDPLAQLVSRGGSILLWLGRNPAPAVPGFHLEREVALAGNYRRICQLRRVPSP
jgi:16S rRNA (guanine527-N7)-methyltransferase